MVLTQTAVLASLFLGGYITARARTLTTEALTTTAAGASPEETVVPLGRRKTLGAFEVLYFWRDTVGPSDSECQCLTACMVNVAQYQ
jgi:hypothetical protein